MPQRQRGVRGEGSIIPIPDPKTGETRWRIKIPARDVFDRSKPITKLMPRGTTEAQAHRERRRLLQERDAGKLQHTAHETVGSLLTRWLEGLAATGAQNTVDGYGRMARRYLVPALGHLPLAKLERKHVRAMLERIIRDGKQPTAALAQTTLVAALDSAIDEGLLVENVGRLVKRASIVRSAGVVAHRPTHKRVPSAEDVALLVAQLEPHPYGLPVAIMATTGMRLAEVLGMAYDHLNRKEGLFLIAQNITYRSWFQLGPTKTGERRTLVLDQEILDRLAQWEAETLKSRVAYGRGTWLREQSCFRVRPGFPDLSCDLIFTQPNGRPFIHGAVRRTMELSCEVLHIPLITPHMLRAFVDTELARARIDPETRRGYLGHASEQMDKVYVHTDMQRLREATRIVVEQLRKHS